MNLRRPRHGLVDRAALVDRLIDARDAVLAVIVAPPGYGKSGLLCDWAARDRRTFLWPSRHGLDVQAAAATIGAALDQEDGCVLVVDDAHRLDPGALHELVAAAVSELPPGSTLAVASRVEPLLPLARLRASHALVEVRTEDLAMGPAEASILLRGAGLELGIADLHALVRRTEGWPGGLCLAALALRDEDDLTSAIDGLRGDEHRLAEYFRDEVLTSLSPDQLEFAIRSSVLDELAAGVCDAILDRRGSAIALSELERASPLLRPLDPSHERYRWHGLFREALNAELRRTAPELVRGLHERASAWYEGRGDVDRAIDHAASAHDPVRTGSLLWTNIVSYVSQGRNDIVQGWLARFSRAELAAHAPLALSAAHSFLVAGNAAEARHWAVAAAADMQRRGGSRETSSLMAGLAGIEAMVARAGIAEMGAAARRGCELEPPDSPWRPVCLFLRGTALHLTGERAAADRLLEEAVDLSAATAPAVTSLCLAQAAMIAIEQRDWDAAAELTDRAADILDANGLVDYPISALVVAAAAASRARHGRTDEAKRDLRRALDLLTILGDFVPWYGAETRILLAHASLWLADVVGARTLLAEASRLARRTSGAVIFEHWFEAAWSHMDALAEVSLSGPSSLTIAELRILRFLPSHRSFREIADQLGVSANTVKTQAHAVYRKLGAASRSEAVARASTAGLLGQ
ncbi:MAG TPA: LuxR C-terminal-related transcriptional regulator [Solirubrobacteraceae bacterium]|nr:LuxR C-terminal-related transcriptional regulator [Solirubrobacteraceae bacterium]